MIVLLAKLMKIWQKSSENINNFHKKLLSLQTINIKQL